VLAFFRAKKSRGKDASNKKSASIPLRAAVYGRVSSTRQKHSGDLTRQIAELSNYCYIKGYSIAKTYSDVGSGLNDQRKGLLRLLRDVSAGRLDVVVVNYQDRLTRFGMQIIREFLGSWAVRLEVIHPTLMESSPHAELITDLTAILYSFMGRLYRLRRKT
jgi:putative resolvase